MFALQYMRSVGLAVLVALSSAIGLAQDSPFCCSDKPPIRPVDKTCLPAGRPSEVPLYRGDLLAKYQEVANVDSFLSDDNCSDTAKLQLKDLQAKGVVIGADALIRVRLLSNRLRGYKENPDTPFWSVKQGLSNDYFYRATAIKYLEQPQGEPQALAVRVLTEPLPAKPKDGADPFSTNKLFRKKSREPRDATVPEVISTTPRSY
ncbi:MAG: hypothetical protein ACR2IE_18760 [Candidatus Sumerlaeaceae bacterium]